MVKEGLNATKILFDKMQSIVSSEKIKSLCKIGENLKLQFKTPQDSFE